MIVGYLLFLPDGAIRFRTGEPDFSSLKDQEYDWTRSVYSGACEQIPHDIPKPLGKHVQTTHYVDANLHHDLATGKAVTAVLHFLNQTQLMHTQKGNPQLKLQPMDLNLLLQGQQLTRSLTFTRPCDVLEFPSETRATCLGQQISCYQLYHPQLHHLQKTPFGILSLSQGSNCSQKHLIPLERWQKQPC